MDPLEAVFLFCFVFGLAMSGLSFVLGGLHLPGAFHHAGHVGAGHARAGLHVGHGGHGPAVHAVSHPATGGHHGPGKGGLQEAPSPVNVNTATAFLAFFGGVGYVLYGTLGFGAALAVVVAVLAGLVGGAIVFFFLVRVLLAGQRFLDPAEFRLEGSLARVTLPIRPDRIGEIVYSKGGTRRSEGARSATGEALAAGTEVVIVRYEKGIAYVQPWESYAGEG